MEKNKNELSGAYQFLKLFRSESEKVTLVLLHDGNDELKNEKTYRATPIYLEMDMKELQKPIHNWIGRNGKSKYFISTYNKKHGFGVFFLPNVGGTKNKDITGIRTWFVDVDFAKIQEEFESEAEATKKAMDLEQTGEFVFVKVETEKEKHILRAVYNQKTLQKKKQSYLSKHQKELKYATIHEVYAGFHIYFQAQEATLENWTKIENALIKKFEGDVQVKKLANLMRVNGFLHQKYSETFETKVIQWSDKVFTEAELIETLDLFKVKPQEKGYVKEEVQEPVSYGSPLTRSVTVIRKKTTSKMELIIPNPFSKLEEKTFNDALQEVLSEPLTSFIMLPVMEPGANFECPFHDDHKPSASVYVSKNDELLFHCHSCGIGTRNIVGLYMAHTGKTWRKSVEDLARIIGFKVVETAFEREQFQKYRDNRHYLDQDLEIFMPNTSKFIDRYNRRSYLRYLNDKAETNVLKEEFQYKNHNVYFVSYRAIMKEMNKKGMSAVQNTVILLNVLGFIERVPKESIPKELLERAEKERKILQEELRQQGPQGEKRADAARLTNFYIVPNWQDNAYEIEKTAAVMNEQKYSVASHNNKIAIEGMLGREIANRVFPDDRVLPKRFEIIASKLKSEIQKEIDEKGFAIAENVIKKRIRVTDKTGKLANVSEKEKEDVLKRAILIDEKYDILKVRSEKKKKELGYAQKTPNTIHVIYTKK